MHKHLGLLAICGLVAGLVTSNVVVAAQGPELRAQDWITAADAQLDPRAIDALSRIEGPARQLLALRAYLRIGDDLPNHWSWSQAQLLAYPNSTEGKQATTDISAVEAAFADANPGFTAHANRMPRSLESQLEHWNQNRLVGEVAKQLLDSLTHEFLILHGKPGPDRLRQALEGWRPVTAAPLAAPGLSAHGQGRAFDFQVERNGQIVAGLDAATARERWDAAGWTRKLHAAVVASGRPFTGPLQSPYEPWHYAYTPMGISH